MDSLNRSDRMRRATLVFVVALAGLCVFAGLAQAASPKWKLLALTGPTNLPPKQSEVQRIAVEAEGGTFTLGQRTAEGEGTFPSKFAGAEVTEGSSIAKIAFAFETYAVGELVMSENGAFPAGTTVLAITPEGFGATLTLSNPAAFSSGFEALYLLSKEVTGVTPATGSFSVGDEISAEILPPGTTVTAVAPETLTISNFPTAMFGGTFVLTGAQRTGSLPFNAPAGDVQSSLEALSAFGSGSVTVSGGPGGDAAHPYFVEFGDPFMEQNVEELRVNSGELVGEHAAIHVFTTIPGGPGMGEITVNPANVGGAPTSGEYTVTLGPLPAGIVTSGPAVGGNGSEWSCPGEAGESTVTCTSSETVKGLYPANNVTVPIEVEPSVASTASAQVTISGGAAGTDTIQMPIVVSKQDAPPGAQAFWAGAFDEDGNPEVQAGGHPNSAISHFMLNTVRSKNGKIIPVGTPKNVIVDLPPGFGGNPLVTPRCPQRQVTQPPNDNGGSPSCSQEMSIGSLLPSLSVFGDSGTAWDASVFNDVPAEGYAAEFTTLLAYPLQSLLASVRTSGDYGVRITAPSNPNYGKIYGAFAALEGFPKGAKGKAFMFNPSDCAEEASRPPVVRTKSDTWQEPGVFSVTADQVLPPVTGCEKLSFHPGFSFQPTSSEGSSGVGATAHLHLPQEGLSDPDELAPPNLKKAVVALPEGLTLNAAAADGLQACSEEQIGLLTTNGALPNPIRFDEAAPQCPDGSKLGTARIDTPLLDQPVDGTIYLAEQEANPFGALIALYLVLESERFGLTIKLPGKVDIGPGGRLTATFDHSPQLPFEDMTLHFRGGGPRSQLASPEICGHYETQGTWTPWSAPESGPPAQTTDGFTVSGNCASSPGARPFAPTLEAGTTNPIAGSYSPLTIKVGRKDGEQELSRFEFSLPAGLSGKLAGIPYCTESAIAAAASKTGKQELASPSCPAASRLGRVDTAAGVGSEPFHVGGSVYLAGPYKGSPVSTVVVTPAVAGPFDLGNVVVRAPVYIDPQTARLTVKSDPIPTILEGLPLKVRSVTIAVDRSGFTINPTSCEEMSIGATIHSSDGATAVPSNRFQVGNCDALKFKPKLKLSLKGGTKRNANPALTAILTNPPGQANIARVSVALPHSEFLDQAHIRTICTRVQFAVDQCPKGSIYGRAEAISPLLDAKLTGPAYLRSSDNDLPDLVIALRGPDHQPVEIELAGRIDSVNGGIRNSFELVPDAPVSKFVLRMQGGRKGLLVNSTDICRGKHKATVKMTGQNGKKHNFRTPLKARCGKKAAKQKRRKG